jgi:hypothetical protein
MTRICWWLVERVSRVLEPGERDAVLGDLAESGEASSQALGDVLGLVVRRQFALWMDWRPWLTLVGLFVPLGMLLSIASRITANKSAVYIWMFAHWWNWAYLRIPGFRADLAHYVGVFFLEYMMLVCLSWTGGFVLGSASRRINKVNGVVFCFVLFFGDVLGAPGYFSYFEHYVQARLHISPVPDLNAPVFAGTFFRVLFPLIVQAVLVAVPSLWGIRQGLREAGRHPLLRAILWIAAIASLAALVVQEPGFLLFVVGFKQPGSDLIGLRRFLQLIVWWPVGYLVASVIVRRWRRSIAMI